MASVPTELSLDLRATYVTKTITDFLSHLSSTPNASHKMFLLDDFVNKLERELAKIHAFKRELPLCMFLLNDAISALKVESAKCRVYKSEAVLEEFIPLKKECDQREGSEKKEKECRDKKDWMSSFQLWNTDDKADNCNQAYECDKKQIENKNNGEERQTVANNLFHYGRNRNGEKNRERGFVMPFSSYPATKKEKEDFVVINGLSLQTPGAAVKSTSPQSGCRNTSCRVVSSTPSPPPQPQSCRKQRRCWTPEFHHRFLKALEELGGSQATPKQIRELMKVDGLTNDEVKSHLQKYRLHTRRVPFATTAASNRYAVNHGSLWVHNESLKGSSSGSPQGPLQLATQSGEATSQTEGDNMIDDDVKSDL